MPEIRHRTVQTNGINLHIAEAGAGPLVLLVHGFPESWYSWRHQLPALAAAGFHARGAPERVAQAAALSGKVPRRRRAERPVHAALAGAADDDLSAGVRQPVLLH